MLNIEVLIATFYPMHFALLVNTINIKTIFGYTLIVLLASVLGVSITILCNQIKIKIIEEDEDDKA